MAKFQYVAVDVNGKEKKGFIEAVDEQEAANLVKQQGLYPTSVIQAGGQGAQNNGGQAANAKGGIGSMFGAPRVPTKELTQMTRQLATLLQAGLPLVRALRTLERQAKGSQPSVFKVCHSLADSVEGGSTFSEALALHPRTFNKLYVSMIRAGEASGAMDVVLNRLAEFMEKAARIAGKVKSAMVYPIAVLVIALGITAGLMIFIIPKFSKMFDDMLPGEPLPAVTQFVIDASNFMKDHAIGMAIGIVVAIFVLKIIGKTKYGSLLYDYLAVKIPPFNGLVIKNVSARFCRTLGTLMGSGVAVLQALQIVKDTAGNDYIAIFIQKVHEAVKQGEGMTRPLEDSHEFPVMLCSMVEVGEETGALPDMLNRVAGVYEEEVDRAVEGLTSLIEPVMIIFLAGIVGTIVVALFAPLVKMIDKLGG